MTASKKSISSREETQSLKYLPLQWTATSSFFYNWLYLYSDAS